MRLFINSPCRLRDELLNREIFTTLDEAKVLIEQWRMEYNQVRPHSARNNRQIQGKSQKYQMFVRNMILNVVRR
jgi:transposase InsO family protein